LIGTLLGAVITWVVSRYYYKRAGDELRQEAFLLHRASSAICYQLENPGTKMKVIHDETGRLTGEIIVYSEGRTSESSSAEGVSDQSGSGSGDADRPARHGAWHQGGSQAKEG
jgi:hypothetical protein